MTIVLAVGSTVAAWVYREQRDQIGEDNRRIHRAENETREQLFRSLQAQARATRFSRQVGQRFGSLKALTEAVGIGRALKLPQERFESLRDEAIACLALPDLTPDGLVILRPPNVTAVAFDATMTRYALRFRAGTISGPPRR